MFNSFFKSIIRKDLLRIFFYNQEKKFYIRELAKTLNTSAGNVQKELRRLEDDQIVKSEKYANLRLFSINKTHPLFPEIEIIIYKTIGIDEEIKKELKPLKGLKFGLIYGSYAKGDFKADSDIDLLLIGTINENEAIKRIQKVEKKILREIHFNLINILEFSAKVMESSFYRELLKYYILVTNNKDEFEKFITKPGKPGKT
ncbi:nucleotidyltransferase domain-containing protein [Candidatus Peregrinibacteria bacterium]|nr:nucleotidyltransferase domain-containing protein [Candidatus Peregrinibacteria bacterium]